MVVNIDNQINGQNEWLQAKDCFKPLYKTLDNHIKIEMQGNWKKKDILSIVIGMAAQTQSIHSIQDKAKNQPAENTLRYHLKKLKMDDLEEKASNILLDPVRELLSKKKPCLFAIDYTDDPYYGEVTRENKEYVIHGIKKKSTTWCYRYATLYLIMGKIKLTLAACPVRNGMNHVDVLRGFLDLITSTGIPIEALLLDRGFWDSDVFFFLQKRSIPYIMPVVKNGERMLQLLSGPRSHFANYQMKWGKRKVKLKIAVVVRYQNGRNNRHGRVHLGYAVNGIDWRPRKIRKVYQKRFGIESSYRMRNIVRAKTTTKNPTIRFLYALVALVMKNIWVWLSWRYFSPIKRGPRTIARDSFSFDRFRLFVWEGFLRLFGRVQRIPVLRFAG